MNDYLWDKSGSDPEIELLENKLGELNALSRENLRLAAPPIEPKRSVLERFRAALLIPAMAGFALILYLTIPRMTEPGGPLAAGQLGIPEKRQLENTVSPPSTPRPIALRASVRQFPQRRVISKPKQRFKKKKIVRAVRAAPKPLNQTAIARPGTALTPEEEAAYAQLMEALSITSSKLMLIKEKVGGTETVNGTK